MPSWIKIIQVCLPCVDLVDIDHRSQERPILYHDAYTAEDIADKVVCAIQGAEKGDNELRLNIKEIVGDGWTENVAQWVLSKLEQTLQDTSKMGGALKEAYDTVLEVALAVEGFVTDHPVFCTVIAIGILVLLAPWAIEALGFAELGPIGGTYFPLSKSPIMSLTVSLGSYAARWQMVYGAEVPKGSLFSLFQQLGMKWHY
jgi:hypothetical protein